MKLLVLRLHKLKFGRPSETEGAFLAVSSNRVLIEQPNALKQYPHRSRADDVRAAFKAICGRRGTSCKLRIGVGERLIFFQTRILAVLCDGAGHL